MLYAQLSVASPMILNMFRWPIRRVRAEDVTWDANSAREDGISK